MAELDREVVDGEFEIRLRNDQPVFLVVETVDAILESSLIPNRKSVP